MEDARVKVLLAFTIVIVPIIIFRRRRTYSARKAGHSDPPKVTIFEPFFGLDYRLNILFNADKSFHRHQRLGHTYGIAPLLTAKIIQTSHADNIQEIAAGKDWGNAWRQEHMKQFCGIGFLTTDGDDWKVARKMIRPCFARKNIDDLEFVGVMVDALLKKVPDGVTLDLNPLLYETFMDSSLHFIFGLDARKKDDGAPFSAQKFHSIWLSGLLGVGLRVGLGSITNILPSSSYTKVCNQIHSFVDFYINQFCSEKNRGNTSTTKRQSVAETIVSTNDDMYSIQSQVIQAMMGAQDTTSSLLGNTIELLARHPLFWEELKREFAEKGDSLLSFDGLRESTVIQNILIESLRVRPVFPAMGREALRDTTLPVGGGPNCQSPIFVPKGIQGVSNFYMLHRDPTVFGDDVEAFNPHRWTSIKPTSKQFAPFGLGGRSCLGKDKALVEAGYVLARLAKEFEVLEFKGAKVYRGVIKMAMKNAEGCKVAIRRNG